MRQGHRPAHGFMPAASPKALMAISRTIRRWTLHQRTDKSLQDLAEMYNIGIVPSFEWPAEKVLIAQIKAYVAAKRALFEIEQGVE